MSIKSLACGCGRARRTAAAHRVCERVRKQSPQTRFCQLKRPQRPKTREPAKASAARTASHQCSVPSRKQRASAPVSPRPFLFANRTTSLSQLATLGVVLKCLVCKLRHHLLKSNHIFLLSFTLIGKCFRTFPHALGDFFRFARTAEPNVCVMRYF